MRRAVIALALFVGFVSTAVAAETPIPAAPTRWVTDQSQLVSETTRSALDVRLERYQRATGHQVIVWIGTTLGDAPIEEWAAKAFAKWGIGQKGKDDGIAIFVFSVDRRIRIEVGYGLEDKLPDAYAARIINEVMQPELKAGHPDRALTGAVDQVLSRVGGEPDAVTTPPLPAHSAHGGPSAFTLIIGGLVVIGFLLLLVTHPRLALWLLWSIASGGRSGGGGFGGGGFSGGGGGGGFSGGGGRSGGGGASGGW
jgi:uncharacterized protein